MQSKFTTTFGQNDAKELITNSDINEIEKLFLKVYMNLLQQNVFKVPD